MKDIVFSGLTECTFHVFVEDSLPDMTFAVDLGVKNQSTTVEDASCSLLKERFASHAAVHTRLFSLCSCHIAGVFFYMLYTSVVDLFLPWGIPAGFPGS